jgi:hypothetical protein
VASFTELWIDPRMMRQPSVALSEEVRAAVNAALAGLREQIAPTSAPDLAAIADRLNEVREAAVPQMQALLQSLTDAQQRIAAAGRR